MEGEMCHICRVGLRINGRRNEACGDAFVVSF